MVVGSADSRCLVRVEQDPGDRHVVGFKDRVDASRKMTP